MTLDQKRVEQGVYFLAEQGLNLVAFLDCATLPADIKQALSNEGIPLQKYATLVLVGHAGRQLWPALQTFGMKTDDPVDHFSQVMTTRFIADFLNSPSVLWLYPKAFVIPLQKLGQLAGWSHPSPLGLGINATYGLWFAYRTAFLTTLPLPPRQDPLPPSPCDSCRDKPCFNACPAQAVQGIGQFKLGPCLTFRHQTASPCQDRCLARLACPVGTEHCYNMKQIKYHYRQSL